MSGIEPESLACWYGRLAPALVLYVRQWLDAAAAEDVVQEVFAKLMRQRRPPDAVQAWLFRAARHAALNARRSQGRRSRHEAARATTQVDWFQADPAAMLDARTAEATLARLPDEQREVIVLRIWGQLGWQAIADLVGRPVSTTFSQYRSGLENLRQRLEQPCRKPSD
ncbi:RNA polymerase sigma factor [Phycisphaerales bacterium AB-hyl4]|uniref:RNA polymerase sigma factor n=1 Tax=Natronomicrosphaera hydrolytica TaxID=3242702 RepID=A0ABV4U4K1_9BACT